MELETVKIVSPVSEGNPHGYIVINKEDFDKEKHEIFVEKADKKADKKAAEKAE